METHDRKRIEDLSTIHVEVRDGVGIVELHRPAKLNALNYDLAEELAVAFDFVSAAEDVRAVLFCGAGRAFCAGADLDDGRVHGGESILDFLRAADMAMNTRVAACPKPVVAAAQGYCVGGGVEFLLVADFAVAADDATFFFTQVELGIIPAGGGISRLVHQVGVQWAARMVLTGERLDAATAQRIGLVTEVVPASELRARAFALAAEIARRPPDAVQLAKQALHGAHEMPLSAALQLDRFRVFPLFASTHGSGG